MEKGVSPIGLTGLYLLGGIVVAALGTTPLAAWLDSIDNETARNLAPKVQSFGARTGLDRPYQWLHQMVRDAEGAKFGDTR